MTVVKFQFLLFFFLALLFNVYTTRAQTHNKLPSQLPDKSIRPLEYITDLPIKIDGGCSFFTYKDTQLGTNKDIFIVSAAKRAFIKYNNTFVCFKITNRTADTKGYVDNYENQNYKLVLRIADVKKIDDSRRLCTGVLILYYKNKKLFDVPIHGYVEEYNFAPKRLAITPLKMLDTTNNFPFGDKFLPYKFEFFLVENYENTTENAQRLRAYALKNKVANFRKYAEYVMFFYKESEITNLTTIKNTTKSNDRLVNSGADYIFGCDWTNYGKTLKIENPYPIDSNNDKSHVTIKIVPILADSVKH